ncbi:GntR family transcriptional regulator [Rhizobium sp. KVB221]|uniref:GntR family transcriptional regulator n=1 Tax=Rhizobium setariae TaxID=2801340 RepID=A0A937CR98_9HYPH|nr:GntR family transcriptional regulator [Rhizobium setariae]MBL0374167.1 GntR family transcriptional regulator [Rhizobium setariae]
MARQNTVFKEAYNRCLEDLGGKDSLPSEPELGEKYGISRTTVRAILSRMRDTGLITWDKRQKLVLRRPLDQDYFPDEETNSLNEIIEKSFMQRILTGDVEPGMQINEAELAREIGAGATSVREFLIRFSRFGLIEKRPNSHWILKGFTVDFALELCEVREMFELRSATAFAKLPVNHPAWADLDLIEDEHRDLIIDLDSRFKDFSPLDEKFHLLVHKASGNRFVIDFYDVIAFIFHYHFQWNKSQARSRNERALREHLDYIAALRSRDPQEIERACRRHLNSARETLIDALPR